MRSIQLDKNYKVQEACTLYRASFQLQHTIILHIVTSVRYFLQGIKASTLCLYEVHSKTDTSNFTMLFNTVKTECWWYGIRR